MSNRRDTKNLFNDEILANNNATSASPHSISSHTATPRAPVTRNQEIRALFPLGHVVATPGAIDLIDRAGVNASDMLARHQCGDWGVVCEEDAAENLRAINDGNRLLSVYELTRNKKRIWVITERDRSVTTLLLTEEY